MNGELASLSDFGSAASTNATATGNAASGPISAFSNEAVEMTSSNGPTVLSTPGPLGPAGDAFGVTWNGSS